MENLNKRPSKGILRFSEFSSRSNSVEKDIKWDEDNIKETLHPDDKDYGHIKIDEPPTPFTRSPHGHNDGSSDDEDDENMRAKYDDLMEKVSKKIKEPPVSIENVESLLNEEDLAAIEQDEESQRTNYDAGHEDVSSSHPSTSKQSNRSSNDGANDSKKLTDFELHRKRHYNEFHAVRLAKRLMQKEMDDDDDE